MPKDPLYIDPTEYEFYKQTHPPRISDYTRRSPEELAADITVAHDNLRRQIRINDKLLAQLERERVWRRVLTWLVGFQFATILIIFRALLPLALRGLAAK